MVKPILPATVRLCSASVISGEVMKNPIVLIGSAPCLYDDFDALPGWSEWPPIKYDYMAIGTSVIARDEELLSLVSYIAALDIGEDMPKIQQVRGRRKIKLISWTPGEGVDLVVPYKYPSPQAITGWSGSSALLGALGALRLGYKKIILIGCPLVGDIPATSGARYEMYQEGWRNREAEVKGKVKSLSGWTSQFLGKPTEGWLNV